MDPSVVKDLEKLIRKRRQDEVTDLDDLGLLEKYDNNLLNICGEDKELWRKVDHDMILPSSEWGSFRSRMRSKVKNGVWDGNKLNDYSKKKLWIGFVPIVEKLNVEYFT